MIDNPQSTPEEVEGVTPEDLSRSYESLLGQQEPGPNDGASNGASKKETGSGSDAKSSAHSPISSPRRVACGDTHHTPKRLIEALLFVGGNPLTAAEAALAIPGLTSDQFLESVDSLNLDYRRQGRPYLIRLQDQGYVLELRPRYKPVCEKIYGGMKEARLSTAAIDVLALVAYRQPATKQEIESIRGAESGHLLRQLVRRRLIEVTGRGEIGQKQVSYGTTDRFLELFGLKSLDDLPQTQDLQKL